MESLKIWDIYPLDPLFIILQAYDLIELFMFQKSIYNEFLFKKILDKKGILLENQIDTKQILNRIKNIDSAPYYDFSFIGRLEEVKNPIRFINLIYMMQKNILN